MDSTITTVPAPEPLPLRFRYWADHRPRQGADTQLALIEDQLYVAADYETDLAMFGPWTADMVDRLIEVYWRSDAAAEAERGSWAEWNRASDEYVEALGKLAALVARRNIGAVA